jgi:RHS repeat-associated protein
MQQAAGVATSVPGNELSLTETYTYDNHGSMIRMPHLAVMDWDYADRLQHTRRANGGAPQDTYFTYDTSGQRVRKVFVNGSAIKERIYLGAYEIYRERANTPGAAIEFERQTLHVMGDQSRIAMVETKTREDGVDVTMLTPRWRFQLDNHVGSVMVEIDHEGSIISYEEYHPYGSTAFHTLRGGAEVSTKRYRYTGNERDEETGLYYHGARYYAPWLGRWTAADPLGITDPGRPGLNLYAYVRGDPIGSFDPSGLQDTEKIDAALRAQGVDLRAFPTTIDEQTAKAVVERGIFEPVGDTQLGDTIFLSNITIVGDPKLAQRARAAGRTSEEQEAFEEFTEHTPGVIQSQDIAGLGKGLVNSPAATVEGLAGLAGLELDLSLLKLEVNPREESGALIGEGIGPGPVSVASGVGKGLKLLDRALELRLPVPPIPPQGARGPSLSEIGIDPGTLPLQLRELSATNVRITPTGVDVVERHLARFGDDPANTAMLQRLRDIGSGRTAPTAEDLNFYTHELREFVRYRASGFREGLPESSDAARELWLRSHVPTLLEYGLPIRSVENEALLYHPDAARLLHGPY